MKATVEQYAKGDFRFHRPEILISEQRLDLKIEAGSVYHGSLILTNTEDVKMRAMVYDDRYLFQFDRHIFVDRKCNITYHFDGSRFEQGKTIRGNFNIISEGGEFVVPYTVEIVAPYVSTSEGPVKDMFQFTALAERSWREALRLFESEDFENTFLSGQPQLKKVYDTLRYSLSANQALEEFLVYMRKKKVLSLSVNPSVISMDLPRKKSNGKLRISRNTWGFTNTLIHTDCPFISFRKSLITSEDFVGNDYTLEYFIEPELIEEDMHTGSIYIENVYQKLTVDVIIAKETVITKEEKTRREPNRLYKKNVVGLIQSYIDFRIGRMETGAYISRSLEILQDLVKCSPENNLYRLGVLHMQLLMGESEYVQQECKRMEADDVAMIRGERESCYYQYIKAMLLKNSSVVAKTAEMVRGHLDVEKPDLFFYWLYMNVAEEFKEDKTALYKQIERLYQAGVRSPIMYIEICDMFNQEPLMFRKIGPLEQASIRWGLKEDFISREVKQSYVLLAMKEKHFSRKLFRTLEKIYNESEDEQCLKVMVSMLIMGNQLDQKYHNYYALAVENSLKLIGLNECFLRSMNYREYEKIPFPVLKYLNYKNTLTEKETAYLYANIIANKDDYVNVYRDYIASIEAFMGEQILKGNMSDDLAVIYGEFLDPGNVNEKYASKLINMVFKRKLTCQNSHIRSVVVKHRELNKEVIIPLVDGVAYIEVITDSAVISLLDEYGNRYVSTIPYRLDKLVEERFYVDICSKYSPSDYRLLLYLHANAKKLMGQNIQEINLARELIHKQELSPKKRLEALIAMISYYDEHYDSDILKKYLNMIDADSMALDNAPYLISLMIKEGLYRKAYLLIARFGFDNISDANLIKLIHYLTNEPETMHDELLTALCVRMFEHNKYDEAVLRHLAVHYRGTMEELCMLWKRAKSVLSDTRELEENALAQLMFSNQFSDDIYAIFISYYMGRNRGMVVKGFLKQTAFRYMVLGVVVPPAVFDIMYEEIEKESIQDDYTSMALLMYMSQAGVTEERKDWTKRKVEDFVKRDKVLPFFKQFTDIALVPDDIFSKTFLVHRSDVHRHIKVNYGFDSVAEQPQGYKTEILEEMLPGLYVKEFVVFRGERLIYSVEDEEPAGVTVIVENDLLAEDQFMSGPENRYMRLNEMLRHHELREDDALIEQISHYLHILHLYEENLKIL